MFIWEPTRPMYFLQASLFFLIFVSQISIADTSCPVSPSSFIDQFKLHPETTKLLEDLKKNPISYGLENPPLSEEFQIYPDGQSGAKIAFSEHPFYELQIARYMSDESKKDLTVKFNLEAEAKIPIVNAKLYGKWDERVGWGWRAKIKESFQTAVYAARPSSKQSFTDLKNGELRLVSMKSNTDGGGRSGHPLCDESDSELR